MKKRTAKFGYGKQEQRMEAFVKRMFEEGDLESAVAMSNIIADGLRARREAGPSIRKPAPWVPNKKGTRFHEGVRVAR